MWRYEHLYVQFSLRLSAILISFFLSGCGTTSCSGDPRTDGVMCASRALSSGAYETQTSAMKRDLEDERYRAARDQQHGQKLTASLNELQSRRRKLAHGLSELLQKIEKLENEYEGQNLRLAQLTRLKGSITNSKERVKSTPNMLSEKEAHIIEEEEKGLLRYSRELREVTTL